MDAANLTKKIDRRNAAIIAAVAVIVLLWFLRRKGAIGGTTIVNRRGANLAMPEFGDFNWQLGDLNIPGVSIPDLTIVDQQSSCGCSLATIELPDSGPRYYAPAQVKQQAPTVVQYQTLVVAPPKPKTTWVMSSQFV